MTEQDFNAIFSKNLRRYLTERNMSQNELARLLNVSPTSINNWVRGLKTPRMDKVDKMCQVLGVRRSDLIEDKANNRKVRPIRVPVYGTIPAGVPIEAMEDIEDYEELDPRKFNPSHEYIALRVRGDSMYPKYLDGDVVILQVQETCESYDDCAVYVNGYDATLKTVVKNEDSTITLLPINPNYAPKTYGAEDDPVQILGVVKELRRAI